MMKLNGLTSNDIYNGNGIKCSYKDFDILLHNYNVTISYKNKFINSFIVSCSTVKAIKNEIKKELNKHDIKTLCNMTLDELRTFLNSDEIEKINSYVKIKYYDNDKKHKDINNYLLNEIKEYFIFRLVRR